MKGGCEFAAIAFVALIVGGLAIGATFPPDQAIRVATDLTSQTLCSVRLACTVD